MELAEIKLEGDGLVVNHNYPCPVNHKQPAVFQCNTGVFYPSDVAQMEGWHLIKTESWIQRLVYKWFFKDRYPKR